MSTGPNIRAMGDAYDSRISYLQNSLKNMTDIAWHNSRQAVIHCAHGAGLRAMLNLTEKWLKDERLVNSRPAKVHELLHMPEKNFPSDKIPGRFLSLLEKSYVYAFDKHMNEKGEAAGLSPPWSKYRDF